jgi:hypothetical protein
MKRLNRKRLILSLAALALLAATTLVLLLGILAPGNIYAAPSVPFPTPTPSSTHVPFPTPTPSPTPTPGPSVVVVSPARLNLFAQNASGLDIQSTYKCSGGTGNLVLTVAQVQSGSLSASGASGNNTGDAVFIVCDNLPHDVSVTLIPLTRSYNLGTATVSATLTDGFGAHAFDNNHTITIAV